MRHDNTQRRQQTQPLHDLLLRVLVEIANRQPEPDRTECMAILKKDGWL